MSIVETLECVVEGLDEAEVPYMVVGSLALSTHGEPQTANDIDVVVPPDAAGLERFVTRLDRGRWRADLNAARRALRDRRQFNLIDQRTLWKVDVIVQKAGDYAEAAFARRVAVDLDGREVVLQSPEDAVLSKLRWARRSGSERQLRDVAGILAISELDWDYLDRWAHELGVAEDLEALK